MPTAIHPSRGRGSPPRWGRKRIRSAPRRQIGGCAIRAQPDDAYSFFCTFFFFPENGLKNFHFFLTKQKRCRFGDISAHREGVPVHYYRVIVLVMVSPIGTPLETVV